MMSSNHQTVIRWKPIEFCSIFRFSSSLSSSCLLSFKVCVRYCRNKFDYNLLSDCVLKYANTFYCYYFCIQGFIIDAFGALRDQLDSVQDELENNCFICGIGKDYLDKVPHGFDIHVEKEHNLANYL